MRLSIKLGLGMIVFAAIFVGSVWFSKAVLAAETLYYGTKSPTYCAPEDHMDSISSTTGDDVAAITGSYSGAGGSYTPRDLHDARFANAFVSSYNLNGTVSYSLRMDGFNFQNSSYAMKVRIQWYETTSACGSPVLKFTDEFSLTLQNNTPQTYTFNSTQNVTWGADTYLTHSVDVWCNTSSNCPVSTSAPAGEEASARLYYTSTSITTPGTFASNSNPKVPILVDPDNGLGNSYWVTANPTFTADVTDLDGDQVKAYFNFATVAGNPTAPVSAYGTLVNSGENSTMTVAGLQDGKYDWRARAEDTATAQSAYTSYWRVKKDTVLPTTNVCTVGLAGTAITVSTLGGSDPAPVGNGTRSGIKFGRLEKSVNSGNWALAVNHYGTLAGGNEEFTTSMNPGNFSDTGTAGNSYAYRYYVTDGAGNVSTIRTCGTVTVPVASPAELVVESISLSPSDPKINETVTATVRVRNSGQTNAGSFRVRFWSTLPSGPNYSSAAESGIADKNISLNAGAFSDQNFTYSKASAGSYTAWALVDNAASFGTVDEGDDTAANNRNSLAYTVTAEPELTVSNITLSPTAPTTNDTVTATVTVQNTGTANAAAARVRFWSHRSSNPNYSSSPESGIGDQNVTLSAGTSQNLNFTFNKPAAGSYTAWALVDDGNPGTIDETNDLASNNRFSFAYAAAAEAELTVDSITIIPDTPYNTQNITARVRVRNAGTAAADNFRVRFHPDIDPEAANYPPNFSTNSTVTDQTVSMVAGEIKDVNFTFTMTTAATYNAWAIVDNGNPGLIIEGNDLASNNRLEKIYTVVVGPNYTLTWTTPSISVLPGEPADYTVNINPDCTDIWTGTLTVDLAAQVAPGDPSLTLSFPSGTTATIKCTPTPAGYVGGSGPLVFRVQTTAATPRGVTHTITMTGTAPSVTNKVAPAGSLVIKEGQWLETVDGDIYSNGSVSFGAAPPNGYNNTNHLVAVSGTRPTTITSGALWYAENYGSVGFTPKYSTFVTQAGGAAVGVYNGCGSVPATATYTKEGIFKCTGSATTIAQATTNWFTGVSDSLGAGWRKITSLFGAKKAAASHTSGGTGYNELVLFIEGDLNINANINYSTASPAQLLVLIVNGQVKIHKNVTRVDAFIYAENGITTNSDATCLSSPMDASCVIAQLVINGGVGIGVGENAQPVVINFNRRINPAQVTTTPAERIVFDPKVMVSFTEGNENRLGQTGVNFNEIQP